MPLSGEPLTRELPAVSSMSSGAASSWWATIRRALSAILGGRPGDRLAADRESSASRRCPSPCGPGAGVAVDDLDVCGSDAEPVGDDLGQPASRSASSAAAVVDRAPRRPPQLQPPREDVGPRALGDLARGRWRSWARQAPSRTRSRRTRSMSSRTFRATPSVSSSEAVAVERQQRPGPGDRLPHPGQLVELALAQLGHRGAHPRGDLLGHAGQPRADDLRLALRASGSRSSGRGSGA